MFPNVCKEKLSEADADVRVGGTWYWDGEYMHCDRQRRYHKSDLSVVPNRNGFYFWDRGEWHTSPIESHQHLSCVQFWF